MESAGFDIIEDRQPSYLLDGMLLITGEVDRTTEYEQGFANHQAWRDGDWQPDPLIHDDQAALLHVRDKGLVVLTGCGHAGIVNIVAHAKRLTGVDQIYAVLGGLHLSGRLFEPIIPQTVAALAAENLTVLVPAHCAGWTAQQALAAALPTAFLPNRSAAASSSDRRCAYATTRRTRPTWSPSSVPSASATLNVWNRPGATTEARLA
jgi:7,8-dihydropterin-6-yl-methyl-4-(beta-D-ribofuranosyl)aminobenzene 5'-phosphate synthase